MKYLSTSQVLYIAEVVTGISAETLARISRIELLESALLAPLATFAGEEFYPDIFSKAAVLGSRILRNHPLQDGNKRLAWLTIVYFLEINGYELEALEEAVVETILALASNKLSEGDFELWLRERATGIS